MGHARPTAQSPRPQLPQYGPEGLGPTTGEDSDTRSAGQRVGLVIHVSMDTGRGPRSAAVVEGLLEVTAAEAGAGEPSSHLEVGGVLL